MKTDLSRRHALTATAAGAIAACVPAAAGAASRSAPDMDRERLIALVQELRQVQGHMANNRMMKRQRIADQLDAILGIETPIQPYMEKAGGIPRLQAQLDYELREGGLALNRAKSLRRRLNA